MPRIEKTTDLKALGDELPPRANHGAAALSSDRLVVVGGEDDDLALGDSYVGTITMGHIMWQRVGGDDFEPRQGVSVATHGNRVLAMGGADLMSYPEGIEILDLGEDGRQWERAKCTGKGPGKRIYSGMAVDGEVAYVHGGFDGVEHLNDTYALDMRSMRWECLQHHDDSKTPSPISQHSLHIVDGQLVRLGGESSSEGDARGYGGIELMNLKANSKEWRHLEGSKTAEYRRSSHAACVIPGKTSRNILVSGGWDVQDISSIPFCVDPVTGEYETIFACSGLKDLLRRAGATLTVVGDSVVHLGGWDGVFNRYSEAVILEISD